MIIITAMTEEAAVTEGVLAKEGREEAETGTAETAGDKSSFKIILSLHDEDGR